MLTKWSLRYSAVAWSSKDSRAMTWHQWQLLYPTLSSTGLLVLRDSSKASADQGHQSTGLSACWSRYGDVSWASRFTIPLSHAVRGGVEAQVHPARPLGGVRLFVAVAVEQVLIVADEGDQFLPGHP